MFEVVLSVGAAPILLAFLTSFGLCSLFAFAPQLFLNQEHMQNDLSARQAQHKRPTPRIGGAAVIVGLAVAMGVYARAIQADLLWALAAGAVVFAVGLREDIRRDMSPKVRLLAAFVSAALAIMLSGAMVPRFGVPYVDGVVGFLAVGVLITMLWSAGACHALNLIDGLNGLASGYSMMAAAGYFVIGGITGDGDVQLVAALLFVALFGFFVLNWPYGRVFLGDAGAYAIGHVLSWLGIILLARNLEGAGLAVVLILFWPVADTAFAIIRRRLLDKDTDQPDRLHFHHLVVRALRLLTNKQFNPDMLNPAATLVMLPFIAVPITMGVLFWSSGAGALIGLLFFALLFVSTYAFSMDYFKSRRFVVGDLPADVQAQLKGYAVEVSDLSGLVVADSRSTYLTICRRAGEKGWSLISSNEAGAETAVFDQFETDVEAWGYFQAQIG
ncbi:glycosyltransferase family 4 protein [Cognatishimia sp. SS12]|uniref:glycosyltransferase family 4 protein n=1 Tax=Cognatishimia sp. SS12 TaxID=2979465 RepID=UPI00232DDC71|nr:MraY family glycosyltransferase [Cognatishimia sp. SS12]